MVPINVTPNEAVQMISNNHYGNIITFTELDLPKFGANHNEPLYITVQLDERRLPRVLVDGGSAMNFLLAKMMDLLGIKPTDLKSSTQTIKAYDSMSCSVLGVATLNLWFKKLMMPMDFQVINIPITFIAILDRPWLHQINGVASALHQCVKFVQGSDLTTIYGDIIEITRIRLARGPRHHACSLVE